jgi:hypothetical protein
LRGHKTAWVVTFEMMSRRAQENLRRFVEEGGTLILGPLVPSMDENTRAFCRFEELQKAQQAQVGKGRMVLLREWNIEEINKALKVSGIGPVLSPLPSEILATRFTRKGKELYFLANPGNQVVSFKPPRKLSPLYGVAEGKFAHDMLSLQPWSVTVWEAT